MGIPVKGSDGQTYTTKTETGVDGEHVQITSDKGVLGALARLFNVLRFFSFDSTSQLRTAVSGSVGLSSNQTLGTVTTANIGIGDMGKPATSLMVGRQSYAITTKAAFKRS